MDGTMREDHRDAVRELRRQIKKIAKRTGEEARKEARLIRERTRESRSKAKGCGEQERGQRRQRARQRHEAERQAQSQSRSRSRSSSRSRKSARSHGHHADWDRPEQRRPRRRRRQLTPEQRAYQQARRRANAKLSFALHLVIYSSVIFFLLFMTGLRVASIVAMSWGIGLSIHWFAVLLAPKLRQRWIDDEVSRQITHTVDSQRQALEGKHTRNLETLSASLAHEIRNPITAAKSLVQQVGEDPASEDNVEYAQVALEELDRVERSISHLLRFAREEEVALAEMKFSDTVDSALGAIRERLNRMEVEITRDTDAEGHMLGDSDKLRRVLLNLFNNALDALEESGRADPRIDLASGENLAGTEIWVRVRDNGPGMDAEQLERIFSPFYTSKKEGTGLGLAISKKLIDAHGGTLEAHSRPGEGTEFLLTLPKDLRQPAWAEATPRFTFLYAADKPVQPAWTIFQEVRRISRRSSPMSEKRTWLMPSLLALFGVAALTLGLVMSPLGQIAGAGLFRGGHDGHSPEDMQEHVEYVAGWVLGKVDATEAQTEAINAILARTLDEMMELKGNHEGSHAEVVAQLTAERIDRDALEAMRAEHLQRFDTASRQLTTAIAEIGEVLSAEQRVQLAEMAENHHGHHGWRGRHGRHGRHGGWRH